MHLLARRELRFQFPEYLPTEEETRPVRSVDASAKLGKTVDFTSLGAVIWKYLEKLKHLWCSALFLSLLRQKIG
jgi:hypothetical protein